MDEQKEIVIVTYLSKFTLNNIITYQVLDNMDNASTPQEIKAILTNEAGIQGIFKRLPIISDIENHVHIIYFATDEVRTEKKELIIQNEECITEEFHKIKNKSKITAEQYFQAASKHYFKKYFQKELPDSCFISIPTHENNQEKKIEKLSADFLIEVEKLKRENQEVSLYVDSTGGFRDTSYLYVLLTKILNYSRYDLRDIIYSKIERKPEHAESNQEMLKNRIYVINDTFKLLDITNGFHEFIAYGKVNTLQKNIGNDCSKEVKNVLKTMKNYADDLSICRWSKFHEHMENLSKGITEIRNKKDKLKNDKDRIFVLLLDEIEKRMCLSSNTKEKKKNQLMVVAVLSNCIENEMYQQALTLYREQMQTFLENNDIFVIEPCLAKDKLEEFLHGFRLYERVNNKHQPGKCIKWTKQKAEKVNKQLIKDERKTRYEIFSSLQNENQLYDLGKFTSSEYVIENIELLQKEGVITTYKKDKKSAIKQVLKDYVIIRELRNRVNHGNSNLFQFNSEMQKYFNLVCLAKKELKNKPESDVQLLHQCLLLAVAHLRELL